MKKKQDILKKFAKNNEDRIMLSYVLDKLETCILKNYITNTRFLDIRQQSLAKQAILYLGKQKNFVFWGGYKDAERACIIFFPEYINENEIYEDENSPITAIRVQKKANDNLSHRDYLGSIMGLQIVRDRIGDIIVCENGADILIMKEICDFLKMNLNCVGRKKVSVCNICLSDIILKEQNQKEGKGSVASLRIDSVISLIFSISRNESQEYIKKGLVFLNSVQCLKSGYDIKEGDKITVRTKGKCEICSVGGKSKKGRQFIEYLKSV